MKINLLIVFLFTSIFLNAQIQKGGLFIGGDVSLYSAKATSTNPNEYIAKNKGYEFSPSVGWVLKDNVLIGGNIRLSFSENEQQPSNTYSKGNRIGGGIWMRKYLPIGKSFYLFGNAGLNAQSIYYKYTFVQQPYYSKEKGYAINASLTPGISYQVRKSLFLEAAFNNLITLGYERRKSEQQTQNTIVYKGTSNSYSLSSSLGNGSPLQIGMRWIIPKK